MGIPDAATESPTTASLPAMLLREIRPAKASDLSALTRSDDPAPTPSAPGSRSHLFFELVDLTAASESLPAAVALTVAAGTGTVELRSYEIDPELPEDLVAARLVAALADLLRSQGARVLLAPATGAEPAYLRGLGFQQQPRGRRGRGSRLEMLL